MTVRRLPIVTIAIIVVTIVLHGLASFGTAGLEERAMGSMLTARLLYLQRPALGICKPLKPFVSEAPLPELPPLDLGAGEKGGESDARDLTERYEAACKELGEAVEGLPARRFGYVPARGNVLGLVTYMFVHADLWHVVGNMWFLFLCGLALEDRWGRLAFGGYYLVAGVVAAGLHHLLTGDPGAALVGASGAVAGAMGAFVVLFATTRIRFVGFVGFRVVSFGAPAYLMLPMWAGAEVLYGAIGMSSGTAHWAHVGGFAFGAAAAAALRFLGVDRKLDDAVERAAVLGNDPRVDAARALVAKGDAEQATILLEGLAKEKPESSHVWEALRDAARASGDTPLAERASGQMAAIEAVRSGRPSGSGSSAPPEGGRTSSPSVRPRRPSRPSDGGSGLMTAAANVRSSATVTQAPPAPPAPVVPVVPVMEAAPFFPPPRASKG